MVVGTTGQNSLREQLLGAFLDELAESVELFNHELLALEQAGAQSATSGAITRMMRAAHSLKGASRIVQAGPIEEACHLIEEVLLTFQKRRAAPDLAIMQALFATVDAMLDTGHRVRDERPLDEAPLIGLNNALQDWVATQAMPPALPSVDYSALDARLVALHRDLGRWREARRRLPPGVDSSRFLQPFRNLADQVAELNIVIDKSIAAMAVARKMHENRRRQKEATVVAEARAHLLVIDDSPTMRAVQRAALERVGYAVTTANNGAQGLDLFLKNDADLIVVDVEMPLMDGYGLAQAVRSAERHADVPIIMVTGLNSPKDREYAYLLGVNRYMVKSLEEQRKLVTVVQELLAGQAV